MLKSLLSLLLSKFYSKKEASEIAALALPNHSDVIDISITEGTNTYIAPADGYINFITARNGGVNVYGQCLQTNSYPSTNRQAKAFVPISKGKKIIFEIGGETISATFYKLVGGGYQTLKKLILQGGGLCCLKHSYSSLRRSSWLARRSGWLISRLIFLRPLQKLPSLLTENATPSQCLTRASWFCNVTASCLQDLTDLTWSISEREQTATSAFLFIPRKATLFLTRLANPTTSEPQTCTSIRLTVANNLSIGGVSC